MLTFHYFVSGSRTHYTHVTFLQNTNGTYEQARASRFGGRTLRDQADNDVTSGSIRKEAPTGSNHSLTISRATCSPLAETDRHHQSDRPERGFQGAGSTEFDMD